MERRKLIRKVLIHFILIYLAFGALHLLSYSVSHPVFKHLKNMSFGVQLAGIVVLDFISFLVSGWIYASGFKEKKKLNLMVEWPSIFLALFLMSIFSIIYFLSITFYNQDIMLVYVLVNPWYGTYMIRMNEQNLYSLWWMLSTVVPSLGYFIGVKSRYLLRGTEA